MLTYRQLPVILALSIPAAAHGQTPEPARASEQTRALQNSPPESVEDHDLGSVAEQPKHYVAVLDGSGLLSLDSQTPTHLLLGATITGGSDSNPNNLAGSVASGLFTLNPYIGLQTSTSRARFLLQYLGTYTHFSSNYAAQSINVASFSALGSLSERWTWEMNAGGSYGQDSVRFLGSQQTVAVGEVPGTGPDSASYLPNAGTATHANGGVGVRFRRSERDTFAIRVSNLFTNYSGFGSSSNIASSDLTYERALSPTVGGFMYAKSASYTGSRSCESFGAGVGLRLQREHTSLSLSGGPQGNTPACQSQQGFSYSVAFNTRLSGKSQIYFLAARQPTSSYLGPGLWQDDVSGGYQRQVLQRGLVSVDAGYVASNTLTAVQSYSGLFVDCVYRVHVAHQWHISYSYRGYFGSTGASQFHRNVALISLVWSPGESRILQ